MGHISLDQLTITPQKTEVMMRQYFCPPHFRPHAAADRHGSAAPVALTGGQSDLSNWTDHVPHAAEVGSSAPQPFRTT